MQFHRVQAVLDRQAQVRGALDAQAGLEDEAVRVPQAQREPGQVLSLALFRQLLQSNPRRICRIPPPLLPRPRLASLDYANNPRVLDTAATDPTREWEPSRI